MASAGTFYAPLLWSEIRISTPAYPRQRKRVLVQLALQPRLSRGLTETPKQTYLREVDEWWRKVAKLRQITETWIPRSQSCPLTIRLCIRIRNHTPKPSFEADPLVEILDFLCNESRRWKAVNFRIPFSGPASPFGKVLYLPLPEIPHIEFLELALDVGYPPDSDQREFFTQITLLQAPLLRSFKLSPLTDTVLTLPVNWGLLTEFMIYCIPVKLQDALILLRKCHRLVRCRIVVKHDPRAPESGNSDNTVAMIKGQQETSRIVHIPLLESLSIFSSSFLPIGLARSFSLPSLHSIEFGGHPGSFRPKWVESLGKSLTVCSFNYALLTPSALHSCLENLPHVTELQLSGHSHLGRPTDRHAALTKEILRELSPTVTYAGDKEVLEGPRLCPRLERLYCTLGGHPNDFMGKDLVEFIVSKRKKGVEIHSESPDSGSSHNHMHSSNDNLVAGLKDGPVRSRMTTLTARLQFVSVKFANTIEETDIPKLLRERSVDMENFSFTFISLNQRQQTSKTACTNSGRGT